MALVGLGVPFVFQCPLSLSLFLSSQACTCEANLNCAPFKLGDIFCVRHPAKQRVQLLIISLFILRHPLQLPLVRGAC